MEGVLTFVGSFRILTGASFLQKACPVRLEAQDTTLSRWRQGFDSPTGYWHEKSR